MAWTSLTNAIRFNGLPKVLAGPILRRVEKDSVSVWIACKESFKAQLLVGPAADSNNQPVSVKAGSNQLNAAPPQVQSTSLGQHLHVALVTTPIPNGLSPGKIYQYLLFFDTGQWLDGTDVVKGGLASIRYGSFKGPTFMLPAATPGDLKFAHVSCRKPHGGKLDALTALDTLLVATHADPAKRPQQLFHTGDQIYADDVADMLLFMLRDASQALVGTIKEDAPGLGQEYAALGAADKRAPGNRQSSISDGGLSTTDGASHLVYLGEFYAMYLFAWSTALWPLVSDFPTFEDTRPGVPQKEVIAYSGFVGTDPPDSKAYKTYQAQSKALTRFRNDLGKVRKALANIPSYMMFDDHEVTDDWFLSKEWSGKALSNPLSRRIMQNALAAFAVFQAWGNTPERFTANTPGRSLLTLLADLATSTPNFSFNDVGFALLPTLNPSNGNLERPAGALDWHFDIAFPAYRLIVLDTRTHRGFDSPLAAPRLINDSHMGLQLPAPTVSKLTIVVSPAPIVGYLPVEYMLQGAVAGAAAATHFSLTGFLRNPARAVIFYVLTEAFDVGTKSRRFLMSLLDFEAWGYHEGAFQEVIRRLSGYGQVVVLSGDVHYSYSNYTHYWNDRVGQVAKATIAQLCSSAAKNNEFKPDLVEKAATTAIDIGPLNDFTFLGSQISFGKYDIRDWFSGTSVATAPHWQYRIRFVSDRREQSKRGFSGGAAISSKQGLSEEARARIENGSRLVLARDSIGVVSFDWTTTTTAKVRHELHWSPTGGDPTVSPPAAAAHTLHEIALTLPGARQV